MVSSPLFPKEKNRQHQHPHESVDQLESRNSDMVKARVQIPANKQLHEPQGRQPIMGWWPFGKKRASTAYNNDPILKDTRTWLSELRDACELNFDNPEEARRQIRHMQVEWKDAMDRGDMAPHLREGLESRAFRLLTCTDKEWLVWLDDLAFWKAGWKPPQGNENEA